MIIGLMGYIGSGKNTVSEFLQNQYGYEQDSFASTLKDACSVIFSWDRELLEGVTDESRKFRETPDVWWSDKLGKEFTPRYALQNIGTEILRHEFHPDIWLLSLEKRLQNTSKNIVITDTRFPNEVQLIRDLGGKIVYVDNGNPPAWSIVAKKACQGDTNDILEMHTTYKHIHESEWAWAAVEPDFVIKNTGTLEELNNNVKITVDLVNK